MTVDIISPDKAKRSERDRSRLIDHFKRLYAIIVGLAITEGCRKLLPFEPHTFSYESFWMFCAFLVTVVPIFQGGERSLDLKYLDLGEGQTEHNRFAFLWDIYMLLFTGLIFVFVAEAITPVTKIASAPPPGPENFFRLMAFLLAFDVFVLIVDFLKSHVQNRLETYYPWILMNTALLFVFLLIGHIHNKRPDIPIFKLAFVGFVFASLRTLLDYVWSKKFMFP